MGTQRIEHVNVTVSDAGATAALLQKIFGWEVRWQGPGRGGGRAVHVGAPDHYVAFWGGGEPPQDPGRFARGRPPNHVGVEVDDLDAVEARVVAAGLVPFSHGDYEPGRRFYFLDPDGIEFEVVSYARTAGTGA